MSNDLSVLAPAATPERMALVRTKLQNERAAQEKTPDLGPSLAFELARVIVQMGRNDAATAERGTPFAVLPPADLAILRCGLEDARKEGRLTVLAEERPDSYEPLVNTLRLNHLVEPGLLPPPDFRRVARHLIEMVLGDLFGLFELQSDEVVPVLPWRAGLLFGEVLQERYGTRGFWQLGVSRNEHTLQPQVFYERPADARTRHLPHLVTDPMIAAGGTTECAVRSLLSHGVPEENIVLVGLYTAPEGLARLLVAFPKIRIVACALDSRLNGKGYIVCGLGDFGDQAFDDLDAAYVRQNWVEKGLLTAGEGNIILRRMGRL